MKFLALLFLLGYNLASYATPTHGHVELNLTQVVRGQCPAILNQALVIAEYDYDFEKNRGLAHFIQLKTTPMNQTLNPLGLSDMYAFMSSMRPTPVPVGDEEVVVYRIIFNIYKNGNKKIMLMLGQEGDCIMSS